MANFSEAASHLLLRTVVHLLSHQNSFTCVFSSRTLRSILWKRVRSSAAAAAESGSQLGVKSRKSPTLWVGSMAVSWPVENWRPSTPSAGSRWTALSAIGSKFPLGMPVSRYRHIRWESPNARPKVSTVSIAHTDLSSDVGRSVLLRVRWYREGFRGSGV